MGPVPMLLDVTVNVKMLSPTEHHTNTLLGRFSPALPYLPRPINRLPTSLTTCLHATGPCQTLVF